MTFLWQDMKKWPLNTGDCLIEVTTSAGGTVLLCMTPINLSYLQLKNALCLICIGVICTWHKHWNCQRPLTTNTKEIIDFSKSSAMKCFPKGLFRKKCPLIRFEKKILYWSLPYWIIVLRRFLSRLGHINESLWEGQWITRKELYHRGQF